MKPENLAIVALDSKTADDTAGSWIDVSEFDDLSFATRADAAVSSGSADMAWEYEDAEGNAHEILSQTVDGTNQAVNAHREGHGYSRIRARLKTSNAQDSQPADIAITAYLNFRQRSPNPS